MLQKLFQINAVLLNDSLKNPEKHISWLLKKYYAAQLFQHC